MITGAVVSTTLTVLVAVAVFPSRSVAVYVTVYEPTAVVSTFPEAITFVDPWNASIAVAPASEYVEPNSTVAGLSPLIVITGGTLSSYPSSVSDVTAATPTNAIKAF